MLSTHQLAVLDASLTAHYLSEVTNQRKGSKTWGDAAKIDDITLATHIPVRVVEYQITGHDDSGPLSATHGLDRGCRTMLLKSLVASGRETSREPVHGSAHRAEQAARRSLTLRVDLRVRRHQIRDMGCRSAITAPATRRHGWSRAAPCVTVGRSMIPTTHANDRRLTAVV